MIMKLIVDGRALTYEPRDSVALALLRQGQHPKAGGPLCLAGDCGNCVATINGVSWVRTCQTAATPGMVVDRHPSPGAPSMYIAGTTTDIAVTHRHHDVVVVGAGPSGRAAADEHRQRTDDVVVFDADPTLSSDTVELGEVVALYAGPMLIVRSTRGMTHVHAHDVILATGAADMMPVCDGNHLAGIFTQRAYETIVAGGITFSDTWVVGEPIEGLPYLPGRLLNLDDGDGVGRVSSVLTDAGRADCDSVVVNLGRSPRDVLARMSVGDGVTVVGKAAATYDLPPEPLDGTVCACSQTTVEDLRAVWDRGFREVELIKRSSLCGTGTCQGAACLPHLLAFVSAQTKNPEAAKPFTARPASRQITMAEAAAGFSPDPWKKTPLHDEHLKLGARMDRFGGWWRPWNYGDHINEYWAVREAVSLGDVSTLGKLIVTGPDAVEFLERVYPTTIGDIKVGRSRYVLLLNERGHLFDDGMVLREEDQNGVPRFVLTFTSGGASNAESWMRDWAETWALDVRIMDRTMSLAAINVTGPLGAELLRRVGVADETVPKFLQHRHLQVADVPCHVMRLSFTGEASWELHHPWNRSVELWSALIDAGTDLGIKPHGLQALFGLRLEKGHIIVGMDTELDTTPRRIDHDWAVKMGKPFFLGQEALARTAHPDLMRADMRKLVPMRIEGSAPPEGTPLFSADGGTLVGHVATSFTSPLLGHGIMLAMLKRGWDPTGELPTSYLADGRVVHLAEAPFYDKEGARART
jgi:glycine cleavage system aminomethyltransferase T